MRKRTIILTILLPICLSVITGAIIITLNTKSILHTRAKSIVETEKSEMRDMISKLKSQKKELERKEAEYNKLLNDNETLVEEIEALYNEIKDYETDIERATAKDAELDTALAEKQSYLEGLGEISNKTEGGKYELKDNDYKCPSDLPVGKYIAHGTGKIYLKDISNRRKDKVDLSTLESNSYAFELAAGESITVEGTVDLTEQIQN